MKHLTLFSLILLALISSACQKEEEQDFGGSERQEEVPVQDTDNSGEMPLP